MPFLQQSEGATVNGGTFIDINGPCNTVNVVADNRRGEGIKLLLASSVQREAIHDSDARDALGCHPDTREEYIRNITSWGTGEWESERRAFLMTGPAGAGKSAIARTCAHKIEATGNLGASFFFFRPGGWNDPKKFIPTIVYQLATRYSAYRDCIDAIILDDPLVLEKAMDIQFRELLVKPLLKSSVDGHSVKSGLVIIVDGLDECATVAAQIQIINLIGTSIREQTTPFIWAFFSRPEPPIVSAFSSEIAHNLSWKMPLTLSGNAESDIEAYLRGSFEAIRAKHSIPANVTWPKEEDIHHLASQSAGLFIYAATAIRYIDGLGNGRSGLEELLRTVLELDSGSTESPFSALDQLYTLVMMQIPEGALYDTMSLLCLHESVPYHKHTTQLSPVSEYEYLRPPPKIVSCCFALGLSSAAFHIAISKLHSILQVLPSRSCEPDEFQFYHKSFLDFVLDPKRSKQYYIKSRGVHQHCLRSILRAINEVNPDALEMHPIYSFLFRAFFILVQEYEGQLEENILQLVSQANWDWCHRLCFKFHEIDLGVFIQKIPKAWRRRIIRPSYRRQFYLFLSLDDSFRPVPKPYFLGEGDKKCLMVQFKGRASVIDPQRLVLLRALGIYRLLGVR